MNDEAPLVVSRVEGATGHPRRAGFRDGFVTAGVIVALALATGVLGFRDSGPRAASSSTASEAPSEAALVAVPNPGGSPIDAGACSTGLPPGTAPVVLRIDRAADTAGVVVAGGLASHVSGGPALPPTVVIESGTPLDVVLPEGRCALAWVIAFDGQRVVAQVDPFGNPGNASTGDISFALGTAAQRDGELQADLSFRGGDIAVAWSVTLEPPSMPALTLVDLPTDSPPSAVDMVDGCAFRFDLASVPSQPFYRACDGREGPTAPLAMLYAQPGARLLVENAGFTPSIQPTLPPVACGQVAGRPPVFTEDATCRLTYTAGTSYEFGFRLPEARGRWIVAVRGCMAGLVTACGAWYAGIDTIDPAPSG